nr:transport protein TonB 0 [Catenovulum maritimum]
MLEGALGGTVNMATIRPLELKEPLTAISIDGEYADKTENLGPKVSAAFGRNWELGGAGTFGANINFAYQDRELRRDEFFNKVSMVDDIDLDGDGSVDVSGGPNGKFQLRTENTLEQKKEQRERTAFGVSLQWAPESADANIYLDISKSELDGGQEAYSILDVAGAVKPTSNSFYDANGMLQNYQLENVFVIPKTWSDFTASDASSNAIGGEWYITDTVKISSEYSISKAEELQTASEFNLRPISRSGYQADGSVAEHKTTVTVNHTDSKVPSLVYDDSTILTGADNLVFREMYHKTISTDNQESAFRFDVELTDLGLDFLSKIKAGVRTTETEYSSSRFDLTYNGSSNLKDSHKKAKYNGVLKPTWIDSSIISDSFTTFNQSNTFDQTGFAGANGLSTYRVYDASILSNNVEQTFAEVQQILAGSDRALTGSLADNMTESINSYKEIEETTRALYTQFHVEFGDVNAVVGGRYVETELTSSIVDYVDANGNKVLDTKMNDYKDFLPSLNATYTLTDSTLVRFAAAKVMRRADFDDLSPSLVINNEKTSGTSGSYELEPYRVTQYDLSLEHYFGDGNLVSAAIFYKDVASFTENRTTCVADSSTITGQGTTQWSTICLLDTAGVNKGEIVTHSNSDATAGENFVIAKRNDGLTGIQIAKEVNGGSGEVTGLELAYQQQLDMVPGLGVNVNYTYADSSQPDGNPLLNISNHTFNGQVYWENDGFQLRLAYNWRDKFLDTQVEKRVETVGALGLGIKNSGDPTAAGFDPTVGNNYRNARGQFDFSASYDLNENVTFVLNAVNLTGSPISYSNELNSDWKYSEADRRYTMGVRAKF